MERDAGVRGRRTNDTSPKRTVNDPSYTRVRLSTRASQVLRLTRMKTHAQPGLPPMPSMPRIAAASRPENADANPVAENTRDAL